ncbi:protein-glutamate methylesterase/protein-glutamine glutaminase [Pararhizobium mangrovi]|uniref:Protein-glutamate methylesterase/protein-glutamine glutaminase n=1 Tax=Pararhizobium mangrovi TaxID=2590452 RepID=A0A506U8Y0_9HYPH|nr:chemotaxis response regulator protein-glutamate methylesterase [Pararhizobium mangrovi]TPW29029.1 chemotaxis response regulator protein-glutamate methylesterase [Pararhizobium mangrovi]
MTRVHEGDAPASGRPVRVLIVDDSPTMRALLREALANEADIEVVAEACEPQEARAKIKAIDPDVVTLDVEMPGMNGIAFLDKIMRLRPTPVIMVSSFTEPGAAAALDALALGAFDCIGKPRGRADDLEGFADLLRAAARTKPDLAARRAYQRPGTSAAAVRNAAGTRRRPLAIGIGSSTGGVEALAKILPEFPADCPPTLIVQHLPASFSASFAERLDKACAPAVRIPVTGETLRPGVIYIAPGSHHMVVRGGARPFVSLVDTLPNALFRPSADYLFASLAKTFGNEACGVLLTGMGRDGAKGLLQMRKRGAHTIAQDRATALVYGMPRAASEIGAAAADLPLDEIPAAIFKIPKSTKTVTARAVALCEETTT